MNLGAMRTELQARGFDYLSSTRCNYFLNNAYSDLCEEDLSQGGTWPFLQTTVTGVAPYTFSDLRQVLSVTDTTATIELAGVERTALLETVSTDLTLAGTPLYWYLEGEVLKVYPTNTSDVLSIRYVQVPPSLTLDADIPLVPDRYCDLIINGAVIQAYMDSDNLMSAYALQNTWDAGVSKMADSLLFRDERDADTVASVYPHGDWS